MPIYLPRFPGFLAKFFPDFFWFIIFCQIPDPIFSTVQWFFCALGNRRLFATGWLSVEFLGCLKITDYLQRFPVILNISDKSSTLAVSSRIAWNDQQWNLHTTVLAKKSWVSLQIPRKLPRSQLLYYSTGMSETFVPVDTWYSRFDF